MPLYNTLYNYYFNKYISEILVHLISLKVVQKLYILQKTKILFYNWFNSLKY